MKPQKLDLSQEILSSKERIREKYLLVAIHDLVSYQQLTTLGEFVLHLKNVEDKFYDMGFEDLELEYVFEYEASFLAIVGYKLESERNYKRRLGIVLAREKADKKKRRLKYESMKKEIKELEKEFVSHKKST